MSFSSATANVYLIPLKLFVREIVHGLENLLGQNRLCSLKEVKVNYMIYLLSEFVKLLHYKGNKISKELLLLAMYEEL